MIASKSYVTFHDFIFDFARAKYASEWGDPHPAAAWHTASVERRRRVERETPVGEVYDLTMMGVESAYMWLSNSLYLLQHNAKVENLLAKRLRNPTQFQSAFYETLVAGMLIMAGFTLEIEDEDDPRNEHCEFIATSKWTKKRYWVEAKRRESGKDHFYVQKQLMKALKKKTDLPRMVFIELNLPHGPETPDNFDEAMGSIRPLEQKRNDGSFWPDAYVFITNHPWLYDELQPAGSRTAAAHGFRIPGFQFLAHEKTLEQAIADRDEHFDAHKIMESIKVHTSIPATFDGDMPELAFSETPVQRLIIGDRYDLIPGTGVVGTLEDAVVDEKEHAAMCVFRLEDGQRHLYTAPTTTEEMAAFKANPETFFGVHKEVSQVDDLLEFYDRTFSVYRTSSREMLLEMMKTSPNAADLQALSIDELAKRCSLALVQHVQQRTERVKKTEGLSERKHGELEKMISLLASHYLGTRWR